MTTPKRHHWWPQLQSRHWLNKRGLVYVTRSDGTFFEANPANIGLQGDLYTRYTLTGEKDVTIEGWFSNEIEGPFSATLDFICNLPGLRRERFEISPDKVLVARQLGFVAGQFRETIDFPIERRRSLARYIAALVVRNPRYLSKIESFHKTMTVNEVDQAPLDSSRLVKTISLNNMLRVFNQYLEIIERAEIVVIRRDCENEFLFSDAGIAPEEPWAKGSIPFDIHAPLTPDISVEVLPVPFAQHRSILAKVKPNGVARLNRLVLGEAERFIFSRSTPPLNFIQKYLGKPAPKSISHRYTNGKLEIRYHQEVDKAER